MPPTASAHPDRLSRLSTRGRPRAASWPVCPLPPQLALPKGGKALVLAPHHDDETLGCGGTLARLCQSGWHVKLVIVTDGALGDPNDYLNGEDLVNTDKVRPAPRPLISASTI